MRTVVLWLMLDVVAVLVLLYDYRRWYGRVRRVAVARRRTRTKQRVAIKRPTTAITPELGSASGADEPVEQLAVNG